jgi:hypothetical protein
MRGREVKLISMRVKVFVLLFCLTSVKLCSQEVVLESGISFSNMKYTPLDYTGFIIKTTSVNNYIASVKYLHHFSKKFYWEAGIGYEGKGATMTEKLYQSYQEESKYSLHYLDCSFSLIYKLKNLGRKSDLEVGLGSYFSSLLAGMQVGSVSLPSEAFINSAIIISRNNELNQALPGVFWPFDLGSVLIARVRKKQFLFSTTYRYGLRNLFTSNSSNSGIYHHSAFAISVGYVLLQKK